MNAAKIELFTGIYLMAFFFFFKGEEGIRYDLVTGVQTCALPISRGSVLSRAVLIDVHAPQNTPAGVYKGVVNVTGGVTAQIPVELTVWDFAMPSTSTLKSAFGLNWNAPCVGHGDTSGPCSYASDIALRPCYVQAALDNHISLHLPWYASTVDSSGVANWSDFDLSIGPFLAGTANTRLPGARLTAVSVNGGWATPTVTGWATHFKDTDWSSPSFDAIIYHP